MRRFASRDIQKPYAKSDEDHQYFNILITNNTDRPINAFFSDTRSSSIIENPSEYTLSVIRFSLFNHNIPTFNFIPQPGPVSGNVNPNRGIYMITMIWNNVIYQESVIYNPLHLNSNIPVPFNWESVNASNFTYYSIFSFNQFLNMINATILSLYNQVAGTAPPKVAGVRAPFFIYNSENQLISFVASKYFDPVFVGGPTIQIYLNNDLYTFFQGLQVFNNQGPGSFGNDWQILVYEKSNNIDVLINPDTLAPPWQSTTPAYAISYSPGKLVSFNGQNYVCIVGNTGQQPDISPGFWTPVPNFVEPPTYSSSAVYVIGDIVFFDGIYYISKNGTNVIPSTLGAAWDIYTGFDSYRMDVEYEQLFSWVDLSSLVFISPSVPLVSEFIPAFNSNTGSGGQVTNSGNDNSLQIITDFIPEIVTGVDVRQNIVFFNQGEYRLANLVSQTPLRKMDVQIYWVDRNNNYFPVQILPQGQATIKFLLRKKYIKGNLSYD